MKKLSFRTIASLGAALVALLLYLVFRPAPLLVESAVVQEGALRVTLEEEGMTRVKISLLLQLRFREHCCVWMHRRATV